MLAQQWLLCLCADLGSWACVALAGSKLDVLTVYGTIQIQLPCKVRSERSFTIKNKGVPHSEEIGDQEVCCHPTLLAMTLYLLGADGTVHVHAVSSNGAVCMISAFDVTRVSCLAAAATEDY